MAELGIVGLLLVLGFLGFAVVAGVRRGPTRSRGAALGAALAILAAGIVSAAIDWTWELPACFGLVVLAAALLTGPATPRRRGGAQRRAPGGRRRREREARTRPSRFGLGVATLLVGWAAIWAGGVLFLTEVKLGDSREAASAGDLRPPRRTRATRARSSPGPPDPGSSSRWSRSWTATSKPPIEISAKRSSAPPTTGSSGSCGRGWRSSRATSTAARRALERARELNPRAPFLLSDRAIGRPSSSRRAAHGHSVAARRESWILPFAPACARAGRSGGLAAAVSWIDWRWILLALSAISMLLPCGVLLLRGRLDVFEPLAWFAIMFLLLFVLRPPGTSGTRTSSTRGG